MDERIDELNYEIGGLKARVAELEEELRQKDAEILRLRQISFTQPRSFDYDDYNDWSEGGIPK